MYTNDSIYLRKSLSIPVPSDSNNCSNGVNLVLEDSEEASAGCASVQKGPTGSSAEMKQDDGKAGASELTPEDFLKRLDGLISQSKQAAVKGCQEAEKRFVCMAPNAYLFTLFV